jgi:hypothetical protein
MERIVYLDRNPLRTEIRRPAFEHEWVEYPTSRPDELRARLAGATIAITNRMYLKGSHLPATEGFRPGDLGAHFPDRVDPLKPGRRMAPNAGVSGLVRGWSSYGETVVVRPGDDLPEGTAVQPVPMPEHPAGA